MSSINTANNGNKQTKTRMQKGIKKINLLIYYQNVGGMKTKLQELGQAINTSDYDIIMLSETWLNEDISDAELGLSGFNIYRVDRDFNISQKKRGGGILIAVNRVFQSKRLNVQLLNVEQVFVEIKVNDVFIVLACS